MALLAYKERNMTREERKKAYQQMAQLMIERPLYVQHTWKCVQDFYKYYYSTTLDEVAGGFVKDVPSISTVERWYRKILENNPWIKERGDVTEYKEIALDTIVVEKDGQVKLL